MVPLIFNLGPTELLIILAILLLLFGGARLAGLGKSTGRALREFKEETKGLGGKGEENEQLPPASAPGSTSAQPQQPYAQPAPQQPYGQQSQPYAQQPQQPYAQPLNPEQGFPQHQAPTNQWPQQPATGDGQGSVVNPTGEVRRDS